jgi:hypothetical protein
MRLWVLLALTCQLAGCGDDPVDPNCPVQIVCREEGRCTAEGGRCVAASAADCRSLSEVCYRFGRCTPDGENGCIVGSDADCQVSSVCTIYGGCHAKDGRCVALTDADCAASSGCQQYGWCTVNTEGECVKVGGD